MRAKFNKLVVAHYNVVVRNFFVALGLIAIWWGIVGLPVFWRDSSLERIAAKVIAGDPFKGATLNRQLPLMGRIERSSYCHPAALRSVAIIHLRMLEADALANAGGLDNDHLKSLDEVISSSLSCAPADPFLWLVRYWVESEENGYKSDYLKYLRMSYRLGPNEGWIALKRNPIVVSTLMTLPPDLVNIALGEFAGLVDNGFSNEAVNILVGPGWNVKDRLLGRLDEVKEVHRRRFVRLLNERGYDVSGLHIIRSDVRPERADR